MLELTTPRYLDRTVPWAPLPLPDLCLRDPLTRHYLPAFTPAAVASGLLASGVWQEQTPGLPLRVWLSGDGATQSTTVADLRAPGGAGITIATGKGAQTITTWAGAFRVRVGDDDSWDDPAPYAVTAPPPLWTKGVGHGHDPKRAARREATQQWLKGWGDLLTRFAPLYPLIVTGTIVGSAVSGAALGGAQGSTFLVQEIYALSQDYWLGWDELAAAGLPLMPARRPLLGTPADPAALLADLRAATSPLFPFHAVPVDGYVLRPATGRDRSRFVAYRDAV